MSKPTKGTDIIANNPLIIYVPDNCIKLVINSIIYDGEQMYEAQNIMGVQDIIDARIQGEEWEYENVRYCLTDKAKEQLGIKT